MHDERLTITTVHQDEKKRPIKGKTSGPVSVDIYKVGDWVWVGREASRLSIPSPRVCCAAVTPDSSILRKLLALPPCNYEHTRLVCSSLARSFSRYVCVCVCVAVSDLFFPSKTSSQCHSHSGQGYIPRRKARDLAWHTHHLAMWSVG